MGCSIEGCEGPSKIRGWCNVHYERWRRHGDPLFMKRPYTKGMSMDEILDIQTRWVGDCREWIGPRNGRGYGVINVKKTTKPASRAVYEHIHGELDKSVVVRHTCDNPPCVNIAHLVPGTQAENIADAVAQMRHPHGSTSGQAKLNEAQIVIIRNRSENGESKASIARDYKMSKTTITDICNRKSWRHVA